VPPSESLRPSRVTPKALTGLAAVLGRLDGAAAGRVAVTGITHDSRSVRPGDLYAALPGARAHGADFAAAAAAAGAVAVLTDSSGRDRAVASGRPVLVVPDPRAVLGRVAREVYDDPAAGLLLLGVTGTNGKTTTAYLLEAGLRGAGRVTGLIGTIETRVAGAAVPSVRTTPEATDLQALFGVMRERGVTAAAMEVSSHALALGRVDATVFDVGIFTNLSQDHLDFHADMADYYAAKARLFTPAQARIGVVDVDGPYGARLAGEATVPVVTISPAGGEEADWRAISVGVGVAGSSVELAGPAGARAELVVRLPGAFNVDNAVAAYVGLVTAGIDGEAAAAGIAELRCVPGRMERIEAGQPFLAVVDYAHTPLAVSTLLGALREVTRGRLIGVLGCGGDRDRAKRPLMGAALARGADVAVLTSDNPRSEYPHVILEAMAAGVRTVPEELRAAVVVEPDRAAAIEAALALARPGDTVVIAGKGHEQGQEAGGRTLPFDDRSVVRAVLARLGGAR